MCGISGIIYRSPHRYPNLGTDILALIQPLETRGPDSAGVALFRPGCATEVRLLLRGTDTGQWQAVHRWFSDIGPVMGLEAITNGQRIWLHLTADAVDLTSVRQQFQRTFPTVSWLSFGHHLEVFKEVGAVANLERAYGLKSLSGSHAIGHTRMATESVVDTDHCHPFTAGSDLAIVHNGQISNYYRLRFQLERLGVVFDTENDSEALAHYIHYHRQRGQSLEATLHRLLDEVDGTFTVLVATTDAVALVRDRQAAKPAVVYETPEMVAIASEYRAFLNLPNFDPSATIHEPDAGDIMLWSTGVVTNSLATVG